MALVLSSLAVGYGGGSHKTRVSLTGSITVETHHLINLPLSGTIKMRLYAYQAAVYAVRYLPLHPRPYVHNPSNLIVLVRALNDLINLKPWVYLLLFFR